MLRRHFWLTPGSTGDVIIVEDVKMVNGLIWVGFCMMWVGKLLLFTLSCTGCGFSVTISTGLASSSSALLHWFYLHLGPYIQVTRLQILPQLLYQMLPFVPLF